MKGINNRPSSDGGGRGEGGLEGGNGVSRACELAEGTRRPDTAANTYYRRGSSGGGGEGRGQKGAGGIGGKIAAFFANFRARDRNRHLGALPRAARGGD